MQRCAERRWYRPSPLQSLGSTQLRTQCPSADNHSALGTQYWDAKSLTDEVVHTVNTGHSRAVQGLLGLKIGPYRFNVRYPSDVSESKELHQWFRDHERSLVTRKMLDLQLGDVEPDFIRLGYAGEGANGVVAKKMERHTGQLFAVKELPIKAPWQKVVAGQEVKFMKILIHVSCHTK